MDTLAEGLWGLADYHEQKGEFAKAIKCLEAICQSPVSFLPIIEVKTRLRIATLLLRHSHNVNYAKSHLERSQLLLKSIPSCFELKCRAYSLLSQCYHLVGAIPSQKLILNKGLELTKSLGDGSQLSTALIIEGDYQNSLATLEQGYSCAAELCYPELQMFFATSKLHVHLMQWDDVDMVERALAKCDEVWNSFESNKSTQPSTPPKHPQQTSPMNQPKSSSSSKKEAETSEPPPPPPTGNAMPQKSKKVGRSRPLGFRTKKKSGKGVAGGSNERTQQCLGLLFYNELLHIFYRFRICDYKNVAQHIDKLDAAMKADLQQTEHVRKLTSELNALNHSLSEPAMKQRDCSLLIEKRAHLQQQLRTITTSNLIPQGYTDSAGVDYERRLSADKLELAPYPIDGEWLPKNAVYALVDLMVVIFGRPKGQFKECAKRIQSGIQIIQVELLRLGITDGVREVDLQHSAIWMAGVYLMLLMQFLENKVAVDLTRADFVEAQEVGC
uniref:Uncharacterized protein n=1 Tax=Chenopodium quinoa TaxID=63459 RepID=A0A803N7S6_CHEQI